MASRYHSLSVAEHVANVVSAYKHGVDLLQARKRRESARDSPGAPRTTAMSTQELEGVQAALARSEDVVSNKYDREFRKFGELFAQGDREWPTAPARFFRG
jgi:hypothetical protein